MKTPSARQAWNDAHTHLAYAGRALEAAQRAEADPVRYALAERLKEHAARMGRVARKVGR